MTNTTAHTTAHASAHATAPRPAEAALVALLRLAYSAERAAAHAYRGHARSVRDPEQRRRIREIERDEWRHRERVGEMLATLRGRPSPLLEAVLALVGRTLGRLCHVTGWLAPMVGAGLAEGANIGEYEVAARLARSVGRRAWAEELLAMAECEWDHAAYFRTRVLDRPLGRRFAARLALRPRQDIRAAFDRDEPSALGAGRVRAVA